MRKLRLLSFLSLGFGFSWASSLQAAQYEFPVNSISKTNPGLAEQLGSAKLARMKPLSRFPLEIFAAGPSAGGKVRYQLPKVLTGKPIEITMGKIDEEDGVRSYQAEDGRAEGTCTGPLPQPTCSIRLKELGLKNPENIALRNKAIDATYKDPSSRELVRTMADLFMEQMPIGVILGEESGQLPSLTARWWKGQYTADQQATAHELCFYKQDGRLQGHYRVGPASSSGSRLPCGQCPEDEATFCGTITDIKVSGNVMLGVWRVPEFNERGWIELQFDKKLSFQGSYGKTLAGKRQGTWSGQLK